MHKPGSRISAGSFGTRPEQGRKTTENMFSAIPVRDRARQSASLFEEEECIPLHQRGSAIGRASGHPVMRTLDVLVIGLSMVTGPLLLLLSVAGLCWAGLRWAAVLG